MKKFDVIIIGGGLCGTFAARSLSKYKLNTLVLEKEDDVCRGISKASSGIIYSGCDTKTGTVKTELCVRANKNFDTLCSDLCVKFNRSGSIMAAFGKKADETLIKKHNQGIKNGVLGMKLLTKAEALDLEPALSDKITSALFVPQTGTVNPWELCIAAYENARDNGVKFSFNEKVLSINRKENGFFVTTSNDEYYAKTVINCGGVFADKIHSFVKKSTIKIIPDGADYIVFERKENPPINHIIFTETDIGKGITLVPTVDGNIITESTPRPTESLDFETDKDNLEKLFGEVKNVLPDFSLDIIRSFGAVRPNPFDGERSISSFEIIEDKGLISLIGIKTPGLTCANEIGKLVAEKICKHLDFYELNPNFSPKRHKNAVKSGEIICQCSSITKNEILEAIKKGATTLEAVKRRCGTQMGKCQGAKCRGKILKIIEEYYEKI